MDLTRALHVFNGEAPAEALRQACPEAKTVVYADPLHEGPTPYGLTSEAWRHARAKFVDEQGWAEGEQFINWLERADTELRTFPRYNEVILWAEHDLYDQLLLIQLLDWFSKQYVEETRFSLICIGEFPDVEPFHGLGQLTPAQLATLPQGRQLVCVEITRLARKAWARFCADDPSQLESLIAENDPALPFLGAALKRHLEQFPSMANGLSRTQSQILQCLSRGPGRLADIFKAVGQLEERPFMGDRVFYNYVAELSQAKMPALETVDGGEFELPRGHPAVYPEGFADQQLRLSGAAASFMSGRMDWVEVNGIDRWLGGVNLCGHDVAWRWSEADDCLVNCS
jgi:hypothetical protein